jgi:hypothetical protein
MPQQLLAPVAPVSVAAPSRECRVYERKTCAVPTSCQPAAAREMRWEATICDVSQGGVRLLLRRRFERGSGLAVELPGKDGERYIVFAKVMQVQQEEDGNWALGCKFLSELSEDELQRLVTFSPPPVVLEDAHLAIELPTGRIVRCRIKRFSVGDSWPLPAGNFIGLSGRGAVGEAWTYRFEVVACDEQAGAKILRLRVDADDANALLHSLNQ